MNYLNISLLSTEGNAKLYSAPKSNPWDNFLHILIWSINMTSLNNFISIIKQKRLDKQTCCTLVISPLKVLTGILWTKDQKTF